MKRIFKLFCIIFLITLTINICQAQSADVKKITALTIENKKSEYPPDIQKIIDRGKISVGLYYKDKPPFIMTDKNGELYGLDIGIARDIAKYLGVRVVFNREAKTYAELHQIAANGITAKGNPIDVVISKFSRTYERAKNVRYTRPYVTFRQALIINKIHAVRYKIENYPIKYLADGKVKIGVRVKTSYVEFAKELFKNAEIVEGEWEDIVKMVVKGQITAIMRDEYEIMKLIKRNPELAIKVSVYILNDRKDHIAMAVPCESINLLAWLDIFLESRREVLNAKDLIERFPEAWK
jgi:ABC-type amino acid transport substrate-binding protein